MKSKLLPFILLILIILNGVLIFMLITKPHLKEKHKLERSFLTEQLNFSNTQEEKFNNLDANHKEKMIEINYQIMRQKDILFNSFGNKNINIDSLVKITGKLEAKKDLEVFTFFNSVKKICTKEQQQKFNEIINKALKGGMPVGPPRREGNSPPPGDGNMPPPPPR